MEHSNDMPKLSKIQKTQKVAEYMTQFFTLSGRLLREVPDAVELLEESLEASPNDFAEAAVRMLQARKEDQGE